MINARGGINGRRIRFITRDDNSDPASALELTRGLVEKDDVHLMFGSFGTPGNIATRWYLNERKIPQLFVASGDEELSQAKAFPWTMTCDCWVNPGAEATYPTSCRTWTILSSPPVAWLMAATQRSAQRAAASCAAAISTPAPTLPAYSRSSPRRGSWPLT